MFILKLAQLMGVCASAWVCVTYAETLQFDSLKTIQVTAKKKQLDKNLTLIGQNTAIINSTIASQIGANRLEDFADYTSGVNLGRNQAGIGSDITIRGYTTAGNLQLDGLPDVQGFYLRDPDTLEQVEIHKGMDSTIFNSGMPGGIVNYVKKQPTFKQHRQLKIQTGSPHQWRTSLDINGALPSLSPNVAGRLVISQQQAQTGRANVGDDRLTIMPSLVWQTDRQKLLLELEHGKQNRPYDFDNVFYQGKPVYNLSYVDPRAYAEREVNRLSVRYEGDLGQGWSTKLQAAHTQAQRDERWIGFAYLPASGSKMPGYYRDAQYHQRQHALKAEISKDFKLGQQLHQSTLGYNHNKTNIELNRQYKTGLFELDIYHPVFDYPLPSKDKLTKRQATTIRTENAVYLKHKVKLNDNLTVNLAAKNSRFTADYQTPTSAYSEGKNETTTWSLGAKQQLNPRWQVFANRLESFAPNLGTDRNDKFLEPLAGVQHEWGVQYEKPFIGNKPLTLKLSTYQIKQKNVTSADPLSPGSLLLIGKTRSKGMEVDMAVPLNKQFSLKGGYSYNDTRITENTDGNTGHRLHNAARHSGSIGLGYNTERLHSMVSAVHVGKRMGDDKNSFQVPAYTRVDAGTEWQLNPRTTISVNARNLLNTDYVAAVEGTDFLVQGAKRAVLVGTTIDF